MYRLNFGIFIIINQSLKFITLCLVWHTEMADSTRCSKVVTHLSTEQVHHGLTSVI